ncbi:MAG TPA: hypothetical protein VL588_01650 [Bdellovibrionota bacterium]|nr:hypothetical protein [Bdellovibrionota bacterium]
MNANRYIAVLSAAAVLSLGLSASGCWMRVSPAHAKRVSVEAVNVQTFPPQDYAIDPASGIPTVELRNVKVFMWLGDGPKPDKVSAVKVISREIDKLDDVGFDLTARRLTLESQANNAYLRWTEAQEDHAKAENDRNRAQRKLDAELAKPEAQQDQGKIQAYRDQIAVAEAAMADADAKRQAAENDAAQAGIDLAQVGAQIEEIGNQVADNTAKGQAQVDQLTDVVDFYSQQPEKVKIEFPAGGGVNVSVSDWDTCLFYKAFQTDNNIVVDPNLQGDYDERCTTLEVTKATYEAYAGRVKFTVKAATGAEWDFNLVRTRYADRFQRIFFQGRVEGRFPLANGTVLTRTGIAKLVDKKNN